MQPDTFCPRLMKYQQVLMSRKLSRTDARAAAPLPGGRRASGQPVGQTGVVSRAPLLPVICARFSAFGVNGKPPRKGSFIHQLAEITLWLLSIPHAITLLNFSNQNFRAYRAACAPSILWQSSGFAPSFTFLVLASSRLADFWADAIHILQLYDGYGTLVMSFMRCHKFCAK